MSNVITRDELLKLVSAEKIKPSELFGADILAEDPSVKGLIESETKRAVAGEYAHRKRTEEGFDKTRGELQQELAKRDERIASLQMDAAKGKVGDLFAKQKDARKLDERQVKFIEKRLTRFDPKSFEDLDKEFSTYLDTEIDEYKALGEVFGVKADGGDGDGKEKPRPAGAEPSTSASSGDGDLPDHLNPEKNPWIRAE